MTGSRTLATAPSTSIRARTRRTAARRSTRAPASLQIPGSTSFRSRPTSSGIPSSWVTAKSDRSRDGTDSLSWNSADNEPWIPVEADPNKPLIYSRTELDVVRVLKGDHAGGSIEVWTVGGSVDGGRMRFGNAPEVRASSRVPLLLPGACLQPNGRPWSSASSSCLVSPFEQRQQAARQRRRTG